MNSYSYSFPVICPNDGENIIFNLTLETYDTIYVEDLKSFLDLHKTSYQEKLADALYLKFGGSQKIEAYHQGILITTSRGK